MVHGATDVESKSLEYENHGVARHKLDVLNSKQINRIMGINLVVWMCCFAYVVTAIVLTNTIFLDYKIVEWKGIPPVKMKAPKDSRLFFGIEISVDLLATSAMFILMVLYPTRVLYRNKYPVTHEQCWVIAMIITNAITMNPLYEAVQLYDKAFAQGNPWVNVPLFRNFVDVMRTVRCVGAGFSIIFFLLGKAHSYSMLKPMQKAREKMIFYLPKAIPLLIYQVVRLAARFHGNICLSVIPFSNLVGMIANTRTLKVTFQKDIIYCTLVTVFEICFLIYFIALLHRARNVLNKVDYLQYRSKQVGFRFFLFVSVVYYSLMLLFDILVAAAVPRYIVLVELFQNGIHMFYNELYGGYSYEYMDVFYLYVSAYAFLPPDSHGLQGWIGPSDRKNEDINTTETLTLVATDNTGLFREYSKSSQDSFFSRIKIKVGIGKHLNQLHLHTHIDMFNFSWLAYDYGRYGIFPSRSLDTIGKREICIEEQITDEETDTNLIISSSDDRIVVAFKGTTSFANMRTDLTAVRTLLSDVIPSKICLALDRSKDTEWNRASVHKGFLDVYRTVAKRIIDRVFVLLNQCERPILLTGHSLGGALAMICSLDLCVSLGLSKTQVLCSTFGSPRVGNRSWCTIYDRYVPVTWRFTHEFDVIPAFPKIGYQHVGKRVVLTNSGNMFLDPNSLEAVMWSTTTPSMNYHRKIVYWHCISLFCQKYSEFEPEFWGNKLHEKDEFKEELGRLKSRYSSAKSLLKGYR